jgi:phosphomevalonate kinase
VVNNDSLKVCEIGPFLRHGLYWILLLSGVILHNEMEKESFVTLFIVFVLRFFFVRIDLYCQQRNMKIRVFIKAERVF